MIYHFNATYVRASKGKCAVASAAYQSAERIYDERLGRTFSYKNKEEVIYSEIMLPKNAPERLKDRSVLWNEVERVNKASNARYARQFNIALPKELTIEQNKELARDYIQKNFVDRGMVADWSLHVKKDNPHIHVMTTMRGFNEDGTWAPNEKRGYALDANGNKIPVIDPKTGKQKIGARNRKIWKRENKKLNDWDTKKVFYEWRKNWADTCNEYVKRIDPKIEQISHLSYEKQGIEKIPTIHEGYAARRMEAEGKPSERIQENRLRQRLNKLYENLSKKVKAAKEQIKNLKSYIEKRRLKYGQRRNERETRPVRRDDEFARGVPQLGSGSGYGSPGRERKLNQGNRRAEQKGLDDRKIADSHKRISGIRSRLSKLDRNNRTLAAGFDKNTGTEQKIQEADRAISQLLPESKKRIDIRRELEKIQPRGTADPEQQHYHIAPKGEQRAEAVRRIHAGYGGAAGYADIARQYNQKSEQRTKNALQRNRRNQAAGSIAAEIDRYRKEIITRERAAEQRTEFRNSRLKADQKVPALETLRKEYHQKYGTHGTVISDWRKRRNEVENEIKQLKEEISDIDDSFASFQKEQQTRQAKIAMLQEKRDACGLFQREKRNQLTAQINALCNREDPDSNKWDIKTQRRKECSSRLAELADMSKKLRIELNMITEDKTKLESKISGLENKQDITHKETIAIKRKI